MSRKRSKKLLIDNRTAADIEARIEELSREYGTGWIPDPENPDVGTAISKLYARCMEENIGRVNEVLDRYHTEFVNMLDISLLPAKPATSVVVLELLSDTVPGSSIPKGTKFIAQGAGDAIFETDHSLYVTAGHVSTVFLTDGEKGSITPLLGTFIKPPFPGSPEEEVSIEELRPFSLFGEETGLEKNALIFYHPTVFDAATEDIFVRIEGNDELVEAVKRGEYRFYYLTAQEEIYPMEKTLFDPGKNVFVLRKGDEEPFDTLILQAETPQIAVKNVDRISFSSRGKASPADAVNTGANDLDVDRFLPFTDTLALYSECYICNDRYFSKAGSEITLEFDIYFEEHRITLNPLEESGQLKIIKRKQSSAKNEIFADCHAQEVAIEYYNGTGWKKLPLTTDQRNLFAEDRTKRVVLTFTCPEDWEEFSSGSYQGRAMRFQLLKSDNCYVRPAVHHYPIIRNLRISYSYEGTYVDARKTTAICGTKVTDLTSLASADQGYVAFQKNSYEDDALYIGLSKKPENGPVSLLFCLEEGLQFSGLRCLFEYYGFDGWRRMKVLDYTQDFTRSGVVMFMPPADMKKTDLEGNDRYYIRVLRVKKEHELEDGKALPKIRDIRLNAVSVSNIETREFIPVYIDEAVADMHFALGAENVLDAEVWVNETGRFSRDTTLRMAAEDPENTEVNMDAQGQISSFFVRYHETTRFETSEDPRVYMLDRLRNELIFGDGVHTSIPRVLDDVALRFRVRCCNGQAGNIPANSITESMVGLDYIGSITNPEKAYGGSNIESLENALERGAGILSSGNRLVSMDDYCRAISSYSDTIDQVACIVGETAEGIEDPAQISFILLMKEYLDGSYAFHRVAGGLKEELLKHSELTVAADKLHIIEPVYVSISVSVWVSVISPDDSFEIQNLLKDCLEEYLDPLGYGEGRGWKIGNVPKKPQILMRLNVLKSRAIVKKSVMIANYVDASGEHEEDLTDLEITPFMVPKSGEHTVHIIY